MARNVTLKDVAKRAGVSYQTVSKVLRGQKNVTPAVRARILSAVAELGYRPNVTARNLRMQSSRLIGYSWQPDRFNYLNPVLEQFQQSIVEAAETLGYHILLFPQHDGPDLFETYSQLVHTGRVDGFILSGLEYDDPRIPVLLDLNVPLVAFGRTGHSRDFPFVDVDGHAGLAMATRHLLDQGHQRIAALAWPEQSRVGEERLSGYRAAVRAAGIEVEPEWIVRGGSEYEFGYSATRNLLGLPSERRPTAIVTVLDPIAIGAMRAIEELGLAVGRNVAVTGFDDMPVLSFLRPGLTSVRQPAWEVGQRVVRLLVNQLEGEATTGRQVMVAPELIVRESSQGWEGADGRGLWDEPYLTTEVQ